MGLFKKAAAAQLVDNETTKPEPTQYPPLLPTLQTVVGMVTHGGKPRSRELYMPQHSTHGELSLSEKASILRSICTRLNEKTADMRISSMVRNLQTAFESLGRTQSVGRTQSAKDALKIETNFQACALKVEKGDLLEYTRHPKRLDTEQATAMVIAYIYHHEREHADTSKKMEDDFEDTSTSALQELMNDAGVVRMINNTCMWRQPSDFDIAEDAREAATTHKKNKILRILGRDNDIDHISDLDFTAMLQSLRRKRSKLRDMQHLTMPAKMLFGDDAESRQWLPENCYVCGIQEEIHDSNAQVISRAKFGRIQKLLSRMLPPKNVTSRYVYDVDQMKKNFGFTSSERMAALEESKDPYAIAYSFVAAQRQRQLKVVSDHGWTRFLVKGEGAMLLQNRPDVLTSFEDILVRRASDLRALTAVRCPKGVRDHFSTERDIKDRARVICEFMERYVSDFGGGKMETLVYSRDKHGGSGRGPVDCYNALCDELKDCKTRAIAMGVDLHIGYVHKFLAKDIMQWNNGWADDAFAGGKIPGWVGYLAQVRGEEVKLAG